MMIPNKECKLSIALDVWGTSSAEPRGVVTLKRLYAKACAQLSKMNYIQLSFTGDKSDKQWLVENGLLQNNLFRNFRIPGRLQKAITKAKILPISTLLNNADIFHSFSPYPFVNGSTKVIGTLVDFVPLRVPQFSSLDMTLEQAKWCKWASQHPDGRWISISEQTRQDAIALGRLNPNQVISINLSVDDDMFQHKTRVDISEILIDLKIDQPYLLCVNTFNNRKNHARLIQAWQEGNFVQRGWQLILVGHSAGNPIVEQLSKEVIPGIKWLGYVTRKELIHLYYGAETFIYPSLYEGFGIPIAEAIVAGKAILTSHRSCMADISGNSAVLVDPFDIDSLRAGMHQVISDVNIRTNLSKNSLDNRMYFSIDRFAGDLLSAYKTFAKTQT